MPNKFSLNGWISFIGELQVDRNRIYGSMAGYTKWLNICIVLALLSGIFGVIQSAEAAGTSSITSVYFYTHAWNSGLYTKIRANCSHGVFIDISTDNGGSYYDGPQRGALNGVWQVDLPKNLYAGYTYQIIVNCHRDANHGVAWKFNVRYQNGSLNGTYRTGYWSF